MPSFEHKKLIERIDRIDELPNEPAAFATWIKAGQHLSFLRQNALENEIVVHASGKYTFVHSAVVSKKNLSPVDKEDLLHWSSNPYVSAAGYVSGGGRKGVWIERGMRAAGSDTLDGARQLVFGRTFEGWTGDDRTYFEVLQEYAHLAGIHWRPEQRAYCRFDENGDLDHVVSITTRADDQDIVLISFKRDPLEQYLAITNSTLVQMFDFTLLRRETFTSWPQRPEALVDQRDDFFYRQKVVAGFAAYTRGVQLVSPLRTRKEIFSSITGGGWTDPKHRKYVEFIAYDWRHARVVKISTNPAATTNYFEADKNSLPFELSPAFFRPEVLLKYKTDRDKYTVAPRDVHCRAAWTLRGYDVNEAGQVHAYICDLRDLPYSEQLHWASFNEEPKASISKRAFISDFKGEFSPHTDALQELLSILHRWAEAKVPWWQLKGKNLLAQLSTPRTASRDEWAEAFMDLAKLIIEGFDIETIRAELAGAQVSFAKDEKSLTLLEKLLGKKTGTSERLEGLRLVQLIRTKAKGHAGGRDAEKMAHQAIKKHESFAAHFEHVCGIVANELRQIEALFGPAPDL